MTDLVELATYIEYTLVSHVEFFFKDDRVREAVKDMDIPRVRHIHVISMGSSVAEEKSKLQYLYPREIVP